MLFKRQKKEYTITPGWMTDLMEKERKFWLRFSRFLQKRAAAIPDAQMKWAWVFVILVFCLCDTWILVDAVRRVRPITRIERMTMPDMIYKKTFPPGLPDSLLQIPKINR
jgi:hypothetical protein